jgi:phenylacetate-coenzyme A ligase PaaK-like adenylate-forming protein
VDDPANEGTLFLGRYIASHTSGSQGQPMLMIQHRDLTRLLFAMQASRGNNEKLSPAAAVRKFLNPARLAIVTLKRGFYPSAAAFEFIPPDAKRFMKVLWLSQTDPDVIDRLNEYRPTVLTGYAGVLEELAMEALAGRLKLAPELRQVVNNSEALGDRARQRIREAFGLHLMNNYATGECTFLTNGCPTDEGAHVNADWAILEVVDHDYRPVPAGTPGAKVLVTNLANHALPFIRYEIGDVVTMATTPCRCGSRLPRVEKIEGRSADTFWVEENGKYRQLIASVFKNALDHAREVREWQAAQVERNRIVIRLEPVVGVRMDVEKIAEQFGRQLALYRFDGLVRWEMTVVDHLGPDPRSGKFRRIVSEVGVPDDLQERGIVRGDAAHKGVAAPHVTSRVGLPAG